MFTKMLFTAVSILGSGITVGATAYALGAPRYWLAGVAATVTGCALAAIAHGAPA